MGASLPLSLLLVLATAPLRAVAQPSSCDGAPRQATHATIVLDAFSPSEKAVRPGATAFRVVRVVDGRDTVTGLQEIERSIARGGGRRRLLTVVQRFPSAGGTIVDTAVSEVATLAPVAHRSHQPSRTLCFDFSANRVTGWTRQSGAEPVSVMVPIERPLFDSNIIELVLAALPLSGGISVDVPFFIQERGGLVTMRAQVAGVEPTPYGSGSGRPAWRVELAMFDDVTETVWIDQRTRDLLGREIRSTRRGVLQRLERVTPVGS